jgi:hypothetical protein
VFAALLIDYQHGLVIVVQGKCASAHWLLVNPAPSPAVLACFMSHVGQIVLGMQQASNLQFVGDSF